MGKIIFAFLGTVLILLSALSSCERKNITNEAYQHPIDTVSIAADPSLNIILSQQQSVYASTHKHRRLDIQYLSEQNAIEALISGSIKTIIISRSLNPAELSQLKAANYQPRSYAFARDALAVLMSSTSKDTITSLLDFEIALAKGKYKVLVDSSGSSTAGFFFRYFPKTPKENVFKAGNQENLCKSLASSSDAYIGLLSSLYLAGSDKRAEVQTLLKQFPILGFKGQDSTGRAQNFYPFQADLESKRYPLIRDWHIITVENPSSSGTGFVNYLLSEPAQRVILAAGLLPARFPGRQIEFIEKP
jgi:phosphate transport system substrate-binding protein